MFRIVKGDLFSSDAEILAHGCNTKGVWGAGIATLFLKKFPHAYYPYQEYCNPTPPRCQYDEKEWKERYPEDIHGTCLLIHPRYYRQAIACLFTQREWSAQPELVLDAMLALREQMEKREYKSVAFPAIGCGLAARGDFDQDMLEAICEEIFGNSKIEATLFLI